MPLFQVEFEGFQILFFSPSQNLYKPCRVRKRKGVFPAIELEQVNATLSEYDQRTLLHVSTNKEDTKKDEGLDFLVSFSMLF